MIGPSCGGGDDVDLGSFCSATDELRAAASGNGSLQELADAAQAVADEAPSEISDAASTMAEEAQAAADGDDSGLDRMQEAETEVATYAEDNC